MKKCEKYRAFSLAALGFAVLLSLGSCNFGPGEEEPSESSTIPEPVVAAEPWEGPGAGEYFNASAGCSLRLDGAGGFVLSSALGRVEGSYEAKETGMVFMEGGQELYASFSGDGIIASGIGGIFLPLERVEDFSALGVTRISDREYSEEPDGGYSLRDYGLELGLSYPEGMSAPENLIADAVVVWDGAMGYVTGRNVSGEFFGEAEDFMEDYMRSQVPRDFRLLYGVEGEFESMELLDEGVQGRLASAEGLITGAEEKIYIKSIMYTSTYADGTVNYICKCFFAPEGDGKSFNALANSVMNMTAVRRK